MQTDCSTCLTDRESYQHSLTLQGALIKLHHCLFLLVSFDRALSHCADLGDGFDSGYFQFFHQVAGQHGSSPSVAVHAVDSNTLALGVRLFNDTEESLNLTRRGGSKIHNLDVVQL